MNLLFLEIRRLLPRAALHGVLVGLCALLLVLYARMNSFFGLLRSLRFLLPSLPGLLLDVLYLYCFLFAAGSGAHALSFADDPDSREDRFSLPLSREQLALSCLAARLCALTLFALCAGAAVSLGAMAFGGATHTSALPQAAALRFPALLCAFLVGFAFSGQCLRAEHALLLTLLCFFLLHGAALLAYAGIGPSFLLYLSPVFTFSARIRVLPALLWGAAGLGCIPLALLRFNRRDLL